MGGDGVYLGDDGVLHVPLYRLAGDEIPGHLHHLGHLVDQGNALGLGGDEVVHRGELLGQFPGAGLHHVGIAEDDKGGDGEGIADGDHRQAPLDAGDSDVVMLFHGVYSLSESRFAGMFPFYDTTILGKVQDAF